MRSKSNQTWWFDPKLSESDNFEDSDLNTHLRNIFFEDEKINPNQNKPVLFSPKGILPALGLSIGGHSLWNGSLVLTETFLNSLEIDLITPYLKNIM